MQILAIHFANSWAWFLMLIPIAMTVYYFYFLKLNPAYTLFSTTSVKMSPSLKVTLRKMLPFLPILATVFLIIAIARPQSDYSKENSSTNGIDIVMALDVSTSMLETDFKPNRLEAAKKVAEEFVEKRPNDRIGLVIFAGESFTQCPPTIDHNILLKQLRQVRDGLITDGTAIGMGLATSVRALQHSKAKSKVVILLTDGVNTAGTIDPNTAIGIAKALKTKVYCIGVGTPRNNILGIDEPLMNNIAKSTGGIYFRAGSNKRLQEIYEEINQLETSEIEVNSVQHKTEEYLPYALIGFALFALYLILQKSMLRSMND